MGESKSRTFTSSSSWSMFSGDDVRITPPFPQTQDRSLLRLFAGLLAACCYLTEGISPDVLIHTPVRIRIGGRNIFNLHLRHVETKVKQNEPVEKTLLAMTRVSPSSGVISLFGFVVSIFLLLLLSPCSVSATSLTYKIDANEKACFYAWVDKVNEKVAFYFAVEPPSPRSELRLPITSPPYFAFCAVLTM